MSAHKLGLLLFLEWNQALIILLARKCPHNAAQYEVYDVTTSVGTVGLKKKNAEEVITLMTASVMCPDHLMLTLMLVA